MSINPKTILTEEGWDAVAPDCKKKDKDLRNALLFYWSLEDNDFDFRCKALSKVAALAGTLKTANEVKVDKDAVNYLAALVTAAKAKQGEVAKAKTEAGKLEAMTQKKGEAEAKQREQEEAHEAKHGEEEDDDDAEGDSFARLAKALQSLKSSKVPYYFIYCKDKPYGLVVAKRDITKSAQHKKELAQMAGGSTTPPRCGQCRRDGGKLIFEMEKPLPGMARILQKWIKDNTSLGLKVMVGTESADDEAEPEADRPTNDDVNVPPPSSPDAPAKGQRSEETAVRETDQPAAGEAAKRSPAGFISGSVGRRGKNKPEDVMAVQEALNARVKAGLRADGKCGPETIKAIESLQKQLGQFKPDGLVEPGRGTARVLTGRAKIGPAPEPPKPMAPPKLEKPTLAKAPTVWRGMREFVDKNIKELKKGVRAQYGAEHPDLLKEIDENMGKLDVIIDKLDHRLADSLEKAYAQKNEAARKGELKKSKTILAEYINYVKSEPLIAHIDANPFGVDTKLGKTIKDHLMHVAQAIG